MSDVNEFDPTIGPSLIGGIGVTLPDDIAMGRTIGPYRIIGKLGEGGMGTVFEAEQPNPRRRVALKVIRGGNLADEIRIRLFQREVETLARLKHPNIAAIHEAGVTEGGEHYFAMELVRGRTLDVFLDGRPSVDREEEVRFRLELFRTICDAVNYAHQRGVIHRDLKPSNIIVAETDDSGSGDMAPTVKVLDFGLARITESELGNTMMTEVGSVRGTLAYMSPEQARGNPAEIDLRTDVYSLGIILYQMMSGARPYEVSKASLYDAIKVICEDPPVPLNKRLGGARVDQDVETITLHALEKDVDRRYPTAGALAQDIGLYLDSRPITARAPSRVYQFRKFAARNRLLVASTAVAVVALVGGIVASTLFGMREATQRRAADEARRGVQTVVEFQQEMLAGVDATRMGLSLAEDLKARLQASMSEGGAPAPEVRASLAAFDQGFSQINMTDAALKVIDESILRRAITTVEGRFSNQPLIRAGLLQSIGDTYSTLGFTAEADTTLRAARDLYDDQLGPGSMKAVDVSAALAALYTSGGEFEKAEPLHRSVVEARRRELGSDDVKTLTAVGQLALMCGDMGRGAEAESLYTMALEGMKRQVGLENRETLNIMNNYAWFLYEVDRDAEAESLCVQTLTLRRKLLGNDHNDTMDSINNLAVLYMATGRAAEAEPLYREGYETSRKLLGDEHPNTLPAMSNLGRLLVKEGKLEEAEVILRRAAVAARKNLPASFFGRGVILQSYGEALVALKRYEEAESPLLEAYSIIYRLDPEGPGIPYAVRSLVEIYSHTGRQREAAEWKAKLPDPPPAG